MLTQSFVRGFATAAPAKVFPSFTAAQLKRIPTKHPKEKPANKTLVFGKTFSDHMLDIDWNSKTGWSAPKIVPVTDFKLHPAATVLHYGICCFEGMKAYIDGNNKVRLFRPDMNAKRLLSSMQRICMPGFDPEEFLGCLKELVKFEKNWIPNERGYSLYLRPTAIGTNPSLGVAPPLGAKLFTICSPVGPYYPEGFKPVKLWADNKFVRAWPGGTGASKLGANYAGGLMAQQEAARKGFAQVMWLFGDNHQVTEVGTMNQFFFWTRKDGKRELITAPLDGTILPGVTRDSVIQLARSWNEFEVTERNYTVHEVIEAIEEGRMIESFGSGTAAIVSPVEGFEFNGQYYPIPVDKKRNAGELTLRIADTIMDIQYGVTPHPWSVVVD